MADTVKTSALKALRAAIRSTPGVGDVVANPFSTLDLETVRYPAVFVYDEPMRLERANRYVRAVLPVHVEVWCRKDSRYHRLGDDVDELAGRVEQTVLSDPDVLLWCRDIDMEVEGNHAHFFTDSDFGGVILRFVAQFQYLWGDPFDHGRTE